MKIAIIGDTHMPKRAKQLPPVLVSTLKEVDRIIHVGDWQTLQLYEELATFAPVEGVSGNVDTEEIKDKFPNRLILTFGDVHIGVVHGHGKTNTTEKRAIDAFSFEDVDIILFGHSHIPILKGLNDIILFNPGSPTDKRRQQQFSFGLIVINEAGVKLSHIFY
ncbi:metallophosphoesterase family protein [Aquibacillus salsiterrae]|uniref:Phosphoesterase n=1 Tax=Aquibacillus salsiterrae TaxID=2950439 RepID=A0A9X3WHT3_9BACI|nr:metallophosphoesterase [Aquibacillus salsiterrae]MDC3417704.1 metallophosphoesterase [Aquibacillus salsiterrae]